MHRIHYMQNECIAAFVTVVHRGRRHCCVARLALASAPVQRRSKNSLSTKLPSSPSEHKSTSNIRAYSSSSGVVISSHVFHQAESFHQLFTLQGLVLRESSLPHHDSELLSGTHVQRQIGVGAVENLSLRPLQWFPQLLVGPICPSFVAC